MLKKLQNDYEKLTSDYVEEVCKRYGAKVAVKVRLADVFQIDGSGLSNELYGFVLMSHFDTLVCNADLVPEFAVEYDGRGHILNEVQIQRDIKKDQICEYFNFPILRINYDFLFMQYNNGLNLLSWLIEVWFATKWFEKEVEEGRIPSDEPLWHVNFQHIPGLEGEFPLWLSRKTRGNILRLNKEGNLEDFSPTSVVYMDQNGDFHSLAWVVIKDTNVVFTKGKIKGQSFPAPLHDLLDEITIVDLGIKLERILKGQETSQTIDQLNKEIIHHQSQYTFVTGGGSQNAKIEKWGLN